ncbi:MAG: glycosyltransferase family 39 protein [Candidatus Eiseniibacteriota bacterium]
MGNPSPPVALPPPGPAHPRLWLGFALAKLALHIAAITRYGYFRDELYYLASTEHLDWGYVEHPPLSIALLALVRFTFGDSLVALRALPALAGAATVVMTGMIARRLGGGWFAQGLACLAALLAPVFLGTNHYYSMNTFDLLLWTLAAWLLLVILREATTTRWIWLGVVLGLGLLNKVGVLWLGLGLGVGLILTPHRRVLQTGGPYLAAAIAGAMFVPHLLWQVANGWPTLEFMRNATSEKMVAVGWGEFIARQVLEVGPGNAAVWLFGLGFALVVRAAAPFRVLAWIYLSVALLLMLGGRSRASYLAVAYPMLLALGGVAWERVSAGAARWWMRVPVTALVVASGLITVPFALPVLDVDAFIRYQSRLGMEPSTEERLEVGPLPQHYADMFGWEELVALVDTAYQRLTPKERARCRVFGQNYGEAGAIDVLGRRLGLPRAMSGHNSYWLWGPGNFDGSVLIIIGGDREDNARFFEEVEIVGQTRSPYTMPYERGVDVSIARRPRGALREAWPMLKHFI